MTIPSGYKAIRNAHLAKINFVFNKRNKDLTKEEKEALKLLKKLQNSEFEFEFARIHSELMIYLDKTNQSFRLLGEIQKIISTKKFDL